MTRIVSLLHEVVRPVLRWRVERRDGSLVMAFPAHKAKDEAEARAFAKERLGDMYRENLRIVALR